MIDLVLYRCRVGNSVGGIGREEGKVSTKYYGAGSIIFVFFCFRKKNLDLNKTKNIFQNQKYIFIYISIFLCFYIHFFESFLFFPKKNSTSTTKTKQQQKGCPPLLFNVELNKLAQVHKNAGFETSSMHIEEDAIYGPEHYTKI